MITRRRFLQAGSLISLSSWHLPAMMTRAAQASEAGPDRPVLVVIQLDGGNDGINTVVPFQDDGYGRARRQLRLPENDLLKLDDQIGLHPQMKSARQLYDEGYLSIVHGVGYPNPDRSHFESMRIWHSASLDEGRQLDGWLGRALDTVLKTRNEDADEQAFHIGEQETPLALIGRRSTAISLKGADGLMLDLESVKLLKSLAISGVSASRDIAKRQFTAAITAADDFARMQNFSKTELTAKYPESNIAAQLKIISQMLQMNSPARVYYTIQAGYDTHADQLQQHGRLLREFSDALKAFLEDLRAVKLDDRVVVMAFSEFGRRVAENNSKGTDHGTAGPVFLAGTPILAGQIGKIPSLTDLDQGDLKSHLDFRQVYSTILENWLNVPSAKVLGESYEQLNLFKARPSV